MPARKSTPSVPCPHCLGTGASLQNGQSCQNCGGAGKVSNEFKFPYHYPFNLTVLTPGVPAAGQQPTLVVPGSPGNGNQQGTNPVILRLGSDNPFQWLFNLIAVSSPTLLGDASAWLQLFLEDLSGTNWPFQSAPIVASLYAGDAKYPWPQLEPLTFGEQTQLRLTGYPILIKNNAVALGIGTGAIATFTGKLNGPVLPGSVSVTDLPGIVVGTDALGDGVISGAGIAGTINYTTGDISVTYTVDPLAGYVVSAAYTQGCAEINAQFDLQGFYLRQLSPSEQQAGNISK